MYICTGPEIHTRYDVSFFRVRSKSKDIGPWPCRHELHSVFFLVQMPHPSLTFFLGLCSYAPSPIPPSTFTFTSTSTSSGLAQPFFPSPSASPRGCKVGSSNHIVSPSNRRSFYPPLIGRLLIAATHPPPPCMSPMIVRLQALISPSFLSFSFNLLPRQFARLT